jgi:hypothetical protein
MEPCQASLYPSLLEDAHKVRVVVRSAYAQIRHLLITDPGPGRCARRMVRAEWVGALGEGAWLLYRCICIGMAIPGCAWKLGWSGSVGAGVRGAASVHG